MRSRGYWTINCYVLYCLLRILAVSTISNKIYVTCGVEGRDLLDGKKDNLQVKESKLEEIFVSGVTIVRLNWWYWWMAYARQKYVQSEKELLQILQMTICYMYASRFTRDCCQLYSIRCDLVFLWALRNNTEWECCCVRLVLQAEPLVKPVSFIRRSAQSLLLNRFLQFTFMYYSTTRYNQLLLIWTAGYPVI
jgi:hypothetical protein